MLPPETATAPSLGPHSCCHSGGISAVHNLEGINLEKETGNGTREEITFWNGAEGGYAAQAGLVGGLSPSSSPATFESMPEKEGKKENVAGLRESSAAQVPPDLTAAIAEHLYNVFEGRDREFQLEALRPDALTASVRSRLLANFQVVVDATPAALLPYEGQINAAIDRVRNALELQSLVPAMAGMVAGSGRE